MTALEQMAAHSYEVRHNPNCPSAFCLVTCGGSATIERHDPRNLYTYGKTLEEAAAAMLVAIEERRQRRDEQFDAMVREASRRAAESRVRGIVWA